MECVLGGGLGRWWGQGRGRGERRVGRGTDTCVYVLPQSGEYQREYQRSALHSASEKGWESAVAKLLSLGADAGLIDKVRVCSYMEMCLCVCTPMSTRPLTPLPGETTRQGYSHMIALTSIMDVCNSHMTI